MEGSLSFPAKAVRTPHHGLCSAVVVSIRSTPLNVARLPPGGTCLVWLGLTCIGIARVSDGGADHRTAGAQQPLPAGSGVVEAAGEWAIQCFSWLFLVNSSSPWLRACIVLDPFVPAVRSSDEHREDGCVCCSFASLLLGACSYVRIILSYHSVSLPTPP